MKNTNYHFFLGGNDLEMETIRQLLANHTECAISDKKLSWGAKASMYEQEIERSIQQGEHPVLIELEWDLPESLRDKITLVDHHNDFASAQLHTPLEQIFSLLALPDEKWTRHFDLVVANDKAHIKGMLSIGAKQQEIAKIRQADRKAQGVTEKDEILCKEALKSTVKRANDQLLLVKSDTDKVSPISDHLYEETLPPASKTLVILSPNEINAYGTGNVINALAEQLPDSWFGGNLPENGYWGTNQTKHIDDVLYIIETQLKVQKN